MIKISQTQDRLFALGVLSAIQYFVRPSPMFLAGSVAIYLGDYKMKTWLKDNQVGIPSNLEIPSNFFLFTEFLSLAARIGFSHYSLKQPLSKVIDSSTDLGRAFTHLVLSAAMSFQRASISYARQNGCTSLGNSILFNMCTHAARMAIFHYFEPKMEFKSLGQTFLTSSLCLFATYYLPSYIDGGDITIADEVRVTEKFQWKSFAEERLMSALSHSILELASTAIILGIGSLTPSYKLEITDTSGQIALNALFCGMTAVALSMIK